MFAQKLRKEVMNDTRVTFDGAITCFRERGAAKDWRWRNKLPIVGFCGVVYDAHKSGVYRLTVIGLFIMHNDPGPKRVGASPKRVVPLVLRRLMS